MIELFALDWNNTSAILLHLAERPLPKIAVDAIAPPIGEMANDNGSSRLG